MREERDRLESLMRTNYDAITQDEGIMRHYGVAPDWRIRQLVKEHNMISPFVESQKRDGVISYGLSSFGYDLRIADEFQLLAPPLDKQGIIDPKAFDPRLLRSIQSAVCVIPANSFVLARTVEYIRMPRNCVAICLGKSTYARCGIICNFTPFEPEWEGFVTIEISNTTPLDAKIYANEGIAQVLFIEGQSPEVSYADKRGKYQGQTGITSARL